MSTTIADRYSTAARRRDDDHLKTARIAASLTDQTVLPPEDHEKGDQLPRPFTDLGKRGIYNLEGRSVTTMFPVGVPFFSIQPSDEIRAAHAKGEITDEDMQMIRARLYARELLVQSSFDTIPAAQPRAYSFRNRKRLSIRQLLVTGDSLERELDDFRLQVFRRDQYVVSRDSAGERVWLAVKEKVDPLTLSDEQLSRYGKSVDELRQKPLKDRQVALYTEEEFDPRASKGSRFQIRQEIDSKQIAESEEPVSPFYSSRFQEVADEDYGRGFAERNLADLKSSNKLWESILNFSAAASKHLWVRDPSSNIRSKDLEKDSGAVLTGRVNQGVVQDVGVLKTDKLGDFQVTKQSADAIDDRLGRAFLLEIEQQPKGDRVTATQIQRIASELDGAFGGIYDAVASEQQRPAVLRRIHVMERKNLLTTLPENVTSVSLQTGIEALGRQDDLNNLLTAVQLVGQLGPEGQRRLRVDTIVDRIFRAVGIDTTDVLKGEQELAQEEQAAIRQQLGQRAGEEAIQTIGEISKAEAVQQAQQNEAA